MSDHNGYRWREKNASKSYVSLPECYHSFLTRLRPPGLMGPKQNAHGNTMGTGIVDLTMQLLAFKLINRLPHPLPGERAVGIKTSTSASASASSSSAERGVFFWPCLPFAPFLRARAKERESLFIWKWGLERKSRESSGKSQSSLMKGGAARENSSIIESNGRYGGKV